MPLGKIFFYGGEYGTVNCRIRLNVFVVNTVLVAMYLCFYCSNSNVNKPAYQPMVSPKSQWKLYWLPFLTSGNAHNAYCKIVYTTGQAQSGFLPDYACMNTI